MKINAYFGNNDFIARLNEDLKNEKGELYLVVAEYETGQFKLSDFEGLNIALAINSENAPIIFTSMMSKNDFLREDFKVRFNALMAKKRVGFLRLPFTPEDLLFKYKELLNDTKEEDKLAIEINRIDRFERDMGTIKHGAQSFLRGEDSDYATGRLDRSIRDARAIGLTGSDNEIIEQIRNFEIKPKNSYFAGKYFPGIFCDIEGTLLLENEVNTEMLSKLLIASSEKPITLWTGGDVKTLDKTLAKCGVNWKVVSKRDFAGATVEIAYDDEEYEVFLKKYGIEVNDFHKV